MLMSWGRIPPNRPHGFGSSAPRFPEKKDETPGPGAYDPKPVKKQIHGGSFSKAERFLRHQLGVEGNGDAFLAEPKASIKMDKLESAKDAFLDMKHPDNRSMEVGYVIPGKSPKLFGLGQTESEYGQHRIGSVSKMFTAFLAMKLCNDGTFPNGLNTTVGEIVDQELLANAFEKPDRAASATLEQLLSHTSGIYYDDHAIGLKDMIGGDTATRSELETVRTTGTLKDRFILEGNRKKFSFVDERKVGESKHLYSNAGYALAGLMMEVAYNKLPDQSGYQSFDSIIEKELFKGVFELNDTVMTPGAIGDCIQGPAGNMTSTCKDLATVAKKLQGGEKILESHFGKDWHSVMTRPRDQETGYGLGCVKVGNTMRHGGLNVELFGEDKIPENRRDVTSLVAFPLTRETSGFVGMSDTNAFCSHALKSTDSQDVVVAKNQRKIFQENLLGVVGLPLD